MRAFFGKYLPVAERRTALWLVLAGTAVGWAASTFGSEVMTRLPVGTDVAEVPIGFAYVIQAFAEFSLVAIAVALLIRFARAPQAIVLYVLLGESLSLALGVLNVPAGMIAAAQSSVVGNSSPFERLATSSIQSLAVGLGAVAGAWVASTVSLARIRDVGFSGDETDGEGLQRRPAARGWHFIGWEGRPLTGDALVAMALVAVGVLPSAALSLISLVIALVPGDPLQGGISSMAFTFMSIAAALAWPLSVWLITTRTGVVSAWTAALAGVLTSTAFVVQWALQSAPMMEVGFLIEALRDNILSSLITVLAALGGAALALRRKPATLAGERHDSGAPDERSEDTAGGFDG